MDLVAEPGQVRMCPVPVLWHVRRMEGALGRAVDHDEEAEAPVGRME